MTITAQRILKCISKERGWKVLSGFSWRVKGTSGRRKGAR